MTGGGADATEAYRDLRRPDLAFTWDRQARRPPRYTRSAGPHHLTLMSAHLQHGDQDQALACGQNALRLLTGVHSHRAREYLRAGLRQLGTPAREPAIAEFRRTAATYLGAHHTVPA